MNIFAKESIITKNNDGTYRLEFPNVEFTTKEGNINGTVIFPKTVSKDLFDENGNLDTSKLIYDFGTDGETIFTLELPE